MANDLANKIWTYSIRRDYLVPGGGDGRWGCLLELFLKDMKSYY